MTYVAQVKLGIPGGEAMASAAAEMLIPMKRVGTPEEAAGAMLLLASPYASFISGQVSPDLLFWCYMSFAFACHASILASRDCTRSCVTLERPMH